MLPVIERIRVRYGETDKMGHAYYGSYMLWLEQARTAFCREAGLSYRAIEERGLFLPVVEMHVAYKGEILYDDVIEAETSVTDVRRATMRFLYTIRREGDPRILTEAWTTHVVMGSERRAVTLPDDLRALLMATS